MNDVVETLCQALVRDIGDTLKKKVRSSRGIPGLGENEIETETFTKMKKT